MQGVGLETPLMFNATSVFLKAVLGEMASLSTVSSKCVASTAEFCVTESPGGKDVSHA